MKCESCGAPLPPGRALCSYCGTTADVDFAGKAFDTVHPPEHARICAACERAMDSLNIGSDKDPFYIDRCPDCLGLFLDPGELEALIDRDAPQVYHVDHLALARLSEGNGGPVHYRKCPVCRKIMNRINYGRSSGVIADQCRDHGVYLDAGELRRIQSWVHAGGRLAAAQKASAESAREAHDLGLPAFEAMAGLAADEQVSGVPRFVSFLVRALSDKR